jgi:hypothetical protein
MIIINVSLIANFGVNKKNCHKEKSPYFFHTAKWRSKIIVGAINIVLHFVKSYKN